MKKISLFVICVIASLFISCEPNITNLNSHEYVDLGLSVKWAVKRENQQLRRAEAV